MGGGGGGWESAVCVPRKGECKVMPAGVIDFDRTKDELLLVKDGRVWRERFVGIVWEGRGRMIKHGGRGSMWEMVVVVVVIMILAVKTVKTRLHAKEGGRGIRKGRERTII